jgi:putative SOS response-associated peptidase YedK
MACDLAVFGLIPHWSRDGRNFRHCYNARSETIAEKPSFRQAWRRGQWCLVPADAFFEPCYETGRAVRWRIGPVEDAPLLLAGLWDLWRTPDGRPVLSFTLITQNADAHPLMSRFHPAQDEKRSVVRVDHADLPLWLTATQEQARALIQPLDPRQLSAAADPAPQRRRDRATPATPATPSLPSLRSLPSAPAKSATSAAPAADAGAQLTLDDLFGDGGTAGSSAGADST